jgi:probable DNA metabolism protein
MMIWRYDGSFEGFLSAVVQSYTDKTLPNLLTKSEVEIGLFDEILDVSTNTKDALKLLHAIEKQLGKKIKEKIYHTFLCDDQPFENDLLRYIRLGFKEPSLLEMISHPLVYAIEEYQKRTLRTIHKMNAFSRFETLEDGTLYAQISPPRNVLPLMGGHFKKRFKHERFIIHDLKRSMALIYDGDSLELHNIHDYDLPQRSCDEEKYQHLWKRFFDHVAISERFNPKLQRSHVPLLYREWMCEFKNQLLLK